MLAARISSQSNLTLPPHTEGSIIFARYRQCAPPPNTCFLGPTRVVHIPNGISIGSAVFIKVHDRDRLTDRSTDNATLSITIDRIYIRSTAMWPTNIVSESARGLF